MKKLLKKLKSWWRKRKREKAKKKAQRKPLEFSKMLAIWAVFIATAAAVASYVLAAFYREAVSDVTTTIFTACIGYLITYAGKSLGEKLSRNKHRLDADGNPLPEDTTISSDSTNIGISIHPPREGWDTCRPITSQPASNFNPPTP